MSKQSSKMIFNFGGNKLWKLMPKMMPVASAEAEGEKRIFFSKNMLRLQTSTPLINQNCWGKQEHTHTPKKKKILQREKKN